MRKLCIPFCLVFILLSSCTTPPEPTEVIQPIEVDPTTGYPAPVDPSDDTSYPGPAFLTPETSDNSHLADTLEIPEPSNNTAIVHGQFVAKDGAGYAYLAGEIYLAPVIYSEGEMQIPFVSLDINNDPTASQRTKDHQFLFVDVAPGIYGVVLHTPVSDYVVLDEVEGFLYIDVKPGDVIDLGVIPIE